MTPPIEWRVHLSSSPEEVFDLWTTDAGRIRFWASSSQEGERGFALGFGNGEKLDVERIEAVRPDRFAFRYFGGSTVTLRFDGDGKGGCDLTLREEGAPEPLENYAGWVSVLLSCKAAADFGVDLRSRDPKRTWEARFVDV
ncbi:MAG TPA: SRPBCC domain-containing protein [Allosphingosinicella sp.]|jgi:uncharacterized protein YndB with AHSA1/START domain